LTIRCGTGLPWDHSRGRVLGLLSVHQYLGGSHAIILHTRLNISRIIIVIQVRMVELPLNLVVVGLYLFN
jgi:hypothetical protein